jgi:hypothetical protein
MLIINQDRDLTVIASTKDIRIRPHFVIRHFRLMFVGWNLYAKGHLLGTFESLENCRITKAEMKQYERAGLSYTIPEEPDGCEGGMDDVQMS